MTTELSREDRNSIEELRFDPTLRPGFDMIKGLVWPDESPNGLSSEGRRFLGRLWVYRHATFHLGLPEDQWKLDPPIHETAADF